MNTAAWEILLASRYATPEVPASMGQAGGSGSELDLLFNLGCLRFHRRAPLKPSRSVLYTYIPLRLMPVHKGNGYDEQTRISSGYGTIAAQLVRMAASTVGEFSAQTIILDLCGLQDDSEEKDQNSHDKTEGSSSEGDNMSWESKEVRDNRRKDTTLVEKICPHIYETIRSMHATYSTDWRENAHKLSTVYILGSDAKCMRVYTTTIVHEKEVKVFLMKHRMFSLSAETSTGAVLQDIIRAAQTVPASEQWKGVDAEPRKVKGALLRMVSSVEDVLLGSSKDVSGMRGAARTAVKSIVLEQTLRMSKDNSKNEQEETKEIVQPSPTETDSLGKPTFDSLFLDRLLMEPNYIPKICVSNSLKPGREVVSLRLILGAFSIAAQAPPTTPLFEAEGDLVYRGKDTLGVLSSVARMAIVLLKSGVSAPLCSAYLATPLHIIRELENSEKSLPTPKAIGTVGISSAGFQSGENEAAGIARRDEKMTE